MIQTFIPFLILLTIATSNSSLSSKLFHIYLNNTLELNLTESKSKRRWNETCPKSRESPWHRVHWRHLAAKYQSKGVVSIEFNHKKISLQSNHHSVNKYAEDKVREKCTCRTACRYGLDTINVNFMQQYESELDRRTIPALKNIPVPRVPPIAGRRVF